jgi:hypothetical protein
LNLRAPVYPGNVALLRSGDISVPYPLLLHVASMLPPHSVVSAQNNLTTVIYASTGPQESTRVKGGWQEPMHSSKQQQQEVRYRKLQRHSTSHQFWILVDSATPLMCSRRLVCFGLEVQQLLSHTLRGSFQCLSRVNHGHVGMNKGHLEDSKCFAHRHVILGTPKA